MVVSCTGGESGRVLNDALVDHAMAARDLTGMRRIEMAAAQEALGVEHRWLGYTDSGWPGDGNPMPKNSFATIPLEYSAEPLVRLIREYKPQVLVAYDEQGGYPHPDHIRAHEIAIHARYAAADPNRYPDAGAPWQIQKTYYDRIFNGPRIEAMYKALVEADPESPLIEQFKETRRWFDRPDVATTHIPVGDFFEQRDAALRSHATQVAPESGFFFWSNDLQREAWPYEDFQLVDTHVKTALPESDLFAGVVDDDDLGVSV
jgi:mycothiol S-conjugate amidase